MSKMKFPITTMEQIRNEPIRELTEEEKKRPYSKYHYKELGTIDEENLAKLNNGPCDPTLALDIKDRDKMLIPGYLPVETGWCLMEDGSGFTATKTFFPGATPEMFQWWFAWHPLEDLRYDIWCPNCHTHIHMDNPDSNKDASKIPLISRNYGKTHYPVEGFSLDTAEEIVIRFYSPQNFGLDPILTAISPVQAIHPISCLCHRDKMKLFGNIEIPEEFAHEELIAFNSALHTVRTVEGGCELRSRYWVGKRIDNGEARDIIMPGFDYEQAAWNNCRHSLIEYANLASFLPQIYKEQGGKIE